LSFQRDTGFFANREYDDNSKIEFSVTAGKGDSFDYHGGWLVAARLSKKHHHPSELGVFLLGGRTVITEASRTIDSSRTEMFRLGIDYSIQPGRSWHTYHQFSVGENFAGARENDFAILVLNSINTRMRGRWSLAGSHLWQLKDNELGVDNIVGEVFGSLSYEVTRKFHIRLNSEAEYRNSRKHRRLGTYLQICWGCGSLVRAKFFIKEKATPFDSSQASIDLGQQQMEKDLK